MRRIVILDSESQKRNFDLEQMKNYFVEHKYNCNMVTGCLNKVAKLDRSVLLYDSQSAEKGNQKILTFVTTYNQHYKGLKSIIKEVSDDLTSIVGDKRVVLATKRAPNSRDLLFKQYDFASPQKMELESQKCDSGFGCKTCHLMSNQTTFTLENHVVKPSRFGNCKSKNCIYLAICKKCSDFYLGQTQTEFRVRVNGHRSKFTEEQYMKSSLAQHVWFDHHDLFSGKVDNFSFAIIHTSQFGFNLDELENSLITKSSVVSETL